MSKEPSGHRTAIVITSIICATLLIGAGIGANVYMQHKELAQQKELKQAEIKATNERAQKERELENRKSQRQCESTAANTSDPYYNQFLCM